MIMIDPHNTYTSDFDKALNSCLIFTHIVAENTELNYLAPLDIKKTKMIQVSSKNVAEWASQKMGLTYDLFNKLFQELSKTLDNDNNLNYMLVKA